MENYHTAREVLESINSRRMAHAGLRAEVAGKMSLGLSYAAGRMWTSLAEPSNGQRGTAVEVWDVNWNPKSNDVRVTDNKIGPLERRVAASTNATKIEFSVTAPKHMKTIRATTQASVSQDVLNGLADCANYTKAARSASSLRWKTGSALLLVETTRKRQRVSSNIAAYPDGSPIEIDEQWVRWDFAPLCDLLWDPGITRRNLDDHSFLIRERILTLRQFVQQYGDVTNYGVKEDELATVGQLAPFYVSAARIAGSSFFNNYANSSTEKALRVITMLESDQNDPGYWPTMFTVIDTGTYGPGSQISGQVVNFDNPQSPFGHIGRNIFKLDAFVRDDAVQAFGIPHVLMGDNDRLNIVKSLQIQQLMANIYGQWVIDRGFTDKDEFVGELGKGIGGVLEFDSRGNQWAHPPEFIQHPAPQTEFVTIGADIALGMRDQVHISAANLGIGKCLAAGSTITDPTTGQPTPIELFRGRSVSGVNYCGLMDYHTVSEHIRSGPKACVRVTLASGRSIDCTPEHRLLLSDGWRCAKDIASGETVAIPRLTPEPTMPVEMQPHEVDFLAVILAEGAITQPGVRFTSASDDIVSLMRVAADRWGMYLKQLTKPIDWMFVGCGRGKIGGPRAFLNHCGIAHPKATQKQIPDRVFSLPNCQLGRFLAMFWMCDGTIDRDGSPSMTLASQAMLRQIQSLLLRFGVVSRIAHRFSKCGGKSFDAWRLRVYSGCVENFRRHIPIWGYKLGRMIDRMPDDRNANAGDSVTVTIELARTLAERVRDIDVAKATRVAGWKSARFTPSCMLTSTGNVSFHKIGVARECCGLDDLMPHVGKHADIWWDIVQSIENIGDRETFDLTVDATHSFVANDIIVHNSHVPENIQRMLLDEASVVVDNIIQQDADEYSTAGKVTLGTVRMASDRPNRMLARLRDLHGFSQSDLMTLLEIKPRQIALEVRVRENAIISRSAEERVSELGNAVVGKIITPFDARFEMADALERPLLRDDELQIEQLRKIMVAIIDGREWPGLPSLEFQFFEKVAKQAQRGLDLNDRNDFAALVRLEAAIETQRQLFMEQMQQMNGEQNQVGQSGGSRVFGDTSQPGQTNLLPSNTGPPESINPSTNPVGASGGLPLGLSAA